jgi:UDP-N-acetylmuramoyl-tripeptide--D-alanyl-D-alanine ligase
LGAAADPAPLAAFQPVAGRGLRRSIMAGNATLLDESYNASSASVRAALSVLRLIPAQRRVAVLGDMRELGDFGPGEHARLADAVTENADVLHCCGELTRHLHNALPASRRGLHTADAETLAPLVARDLRPGDAVLVKGSYGSRMRVVVQALEAV